MRVMCAMSGGVDSSVAAALLRDEGHDVVGVTLKLWGGPSDAGCCSVADVDDARRVAQQLGIRHTVFGFGDEFLAGVVQPYVDAHAAGRTPNPCIECNRTIKFDVLLRRAAQLGFDAIATGHHARVVDGPRLGRGADRAKDQSYVLHMLSPAVLSQVLFPVGAMTKDDVRAIASTLGLRTSAKPDSQEVCFLPGGGRDRRAVIPTTPGRIVDVDGDEVGSVDAVQLVTVGQRRGLGALGPEPRYVVDVDVPSATVTVGPLAALLVDTVRIDGWCGGDEPTGRVLVQTSAHGAARPASYADGVVRFDEPVRKVAPGQSVVLYDGDVVLGGGVAV